MATSHLQITRESKMATQGNTDTQIHFDVLTKNANRFRGSNPVKAGSTRMPLKQGRSHDGCERIIAEILTHIKSPSTLMSVVRGMLFGKST